jgi:hypothetical protein
MASRMDYLYPKRMAEETRMAKKWRIFSGWLNQSKYLHQFEIGAKDVKVKIVINTIQLDETSEPPVKERRAEVWSGEMEILPDGEYLTKISIIAEGINEPICDIPFSPMTGYYQWIPPLVDSEELETTEQRIIDETRPL